MRVASWNVNNVLKRLDLLLDWLAQTQPDVVALQELKAETAAFPAEALREAGYESLVVGQRTWNGVALLSRGHEIVEVATRLPGEPADKESRYVEAAIKGVLFGCLYLPNGNPQPGPKFDYKLRWFERMRKRAAALWESGEPAVLLGDWNVVPTDADIYKPDTWRDDALLQPEAREAFSRLLAQGWTDAIGHVYEGRQVPFTFWDYRRKRWERDAGLRIDHILVGGGLEVVDAGVDKDERGKESPSDHAPVWAELKRKKTVRGARAKSTSVEGASKRAKALTVKVTHPERVIDKTSGVTKLELVTYYDSIAPWMLPHLKDRPVSLVRAPTGIAGQLFFQKHSEAKMVGMTELNAALWPGHDALLAVNSAEALVNAAQMNAIEFHCWNSKAKKIDQPDRVIFDLDPGEGVTWAHLQEAAKLVNGFLEHLGLQAWLKTSGGKGLHVVVPLTSKLDYDAVKAFSQSVVQHMAKVIPQRFVAKSGGANRVGKIFIDYLRNGHGQTTAAAFSARARPGLGVSMPVSWDLLDELKSGSQWTIRTARDYVAAQQYDPWANYWKTRQTLTKAIKALKP